MFSAAIKSGAAASAPVDAQFNYVTMLLHADGTNGATNGGSSTSNTPPFNTDASTNAFTIVNNGDTKPNNFNPYQDGYYGNYFAYNSTAANYLVTSSVSLSGTFTIEGYVNWDGVGSNPNMFTLGDSSLSTGMEVYLSGGNWIVYAAGATRITGSAGIVGQWTYIAVTRSGSTVTLYINGTSQGTWTSSATFSGTIKVGAEYYASTYYSSMSGYISNFRVNNTTAINTVPTTPLTAVSGTILLTCQNNRFIDSSASPLTITVNGTPSVSYNQPFTLPSTYSTYGSGYFDGSGDYLKAANNTALQIGSSDFTIECWYYSTVAAGDVLWSKAANGSAYTGYYMNVQGGGRTPNFYATANGSSWAVNLSSSITLKLNSWNHIAVTRNGSTWTVWVNGVSGGTATSSATILDDGSAFTIGALADATSLITGYVSDLRFVKGTAVYTATFTPPTAPLTAISGTSLLTVQTNGAANDSGFLDSSPNDFLITRNGNTTQGSFSPYGSNWSNYFDGTQTLAFPSNTAFAFGTGAYTVEMWVFATGIGSNGYSHFFNAGNATGSFGFAAGSDYSLNIFGYGTGAVITGSANDITKNAWNHIAVCRSSTSSNDTKIYVNGVLKTTGTDATNWTVTTTPAVGGITNLSGYSTLGYISNCRVVKGTAVYTSAFTPSTTPLTAISGTSLLTCQSNRFVDNSSNAFALTVGGTPSVQRFNPFGTSTAYSTATIGGSGYFDGTGDSLAAAANSSNLGTGDFNITFWMYASADPTNAVPATNAYNASFTGGWLFQVADPTTLYFYCGSASGGIGGPVPNIQNQWNYVEATRSGSTIRLFVNGVQINSATNSTSGTSSGNVTRIGARLDGTALYFPGYITDFKVVVGTAGHTSSYTPPTAPASSSGSTLMLSMQNAAIYDNAMMNDLETVGNAQISTSVKKYGTGSLAFDGTGDYLAANSSGTNIAAFGTGDFTIECWIYKNSGNTQNIFDFRPYNDAGSTIPYPTIYINASNYLVWYALNADRITSTTAINDGSWYHIAVCRSGTSTKLFINGTQSGSTYTDSNSYQCGAARPVIGANGFSPGDFSFNGYIDDFRITKGYARYTTTFTPPTAAFPNTGPN